MAGALLTAARVSGHGMRTNSACLHCRAAHEDEVDVRWDCPEWEQARETRSPWLLDATAALPQPGLPDQWPSCLRRAGLFPLRLAQGVERALTDEFLYRLYRMCLAVLAAYMAAGLGDQAGYGNSLFPDHLRPLPRTLPLGRFCRPPPGGCGPQPFAPSARGPATLAVASRFCLGLGPMGRAVVWMPGPAEVSWAELAFRAFVGRVLPGPL